MFGAWEIISESLLLAAAAAPVARLRPALARPRRGSVDLGDRDAPPRRRRDGEAGPATPVEPREPWLVGAAWTALFVTVGFAVRGAVGLV